MLTKEEEAEARAEAEEEFMREVKGGRKNNQGKKKGDKIRAPGLLPEPEDVWGSLFGEGIGGKLPRFANRITLKVSEQSNFPLKSYLSLFIGYFVNFP